MNNIDSYVNLQGQQSFSELPFNEVDNLVFCYLVYYHFEGIVPSPGKNEAIRLADAARLYRERVGDAQGNVRPELLQDLAGAPRFRDLLLSRRVDVFRENITQFSSLCIEIPDGPFFIAFRGVDTTLTGWKEAFQFSYETSPAQKMAAKTLQRLLPSLCENGRHWYTGGHSKGGNLALYALLHIEKKYRDLLLTFYSNDAPALRPGTYDPAVWQEVQSRTWRIVPQFSVLDSLFRSTAPDRIVPVDAKGLEQHEPYLWQVDGTAFASAPACDPVAKSLQKLTRICLQKTTPEELASFTNTLFRIMHKRHAAGKKTNFGSLRELFLITVSTLSGADRKTRRVVWHFLTAVAIVRHPKLFGRFDASQDLPYPK